MTRFSHAIPASGRILLALVAVLTLLLGQGPAIALADAPGTPIPTNAEPLDPQTIRVTWRNTASPTNGSGIQVEGTTLFNLRYRVQGTPDDFSSYTYIGGGGPPDDRGLSVNPLPFSENQGDMLSYAVDTLSSDTTYCFSVRAWAYEYDILNVYVAFSPWSGEVCGRTPLKTVHFHPGMPSFTPTGPNVEPQPKSPTVPGLEPAMQPNPDFVAVRIDGPQMLKDGIAQTYQAVIRNDGSATNGLEVQINFSGALEAWSLPQPGTAAGMTCTEKQVQTGTAFTCKGGTIGAGQTVTVQFQAHAARTGGGDISIVLNPNRTLPEMNYADEVASLHVTVS